MEDSATAEISRSQVWQWLRHATRLEDNGEIITRHLVADYMKDVIGDLRDCCPDVKLLTTSAQVSHYVHSQVSKLNIISSYIKFC